MVIPTLEALAVVIALKIRCGQAREKMRSKVMLVPDNRGNGAALDQLMSTKFPSSAVLLEPATYVKNRGLRAIVEWAPREFNRETDRLAKGVTDGFGPRLEMKIDPGELVWDFLP